MARGGVDKEFAATVILEAIYLGDEKAAQRYDISIKSVERYRKLWAQGDKELVEFVRMKRQAFDREWAQSLPLALQQSVEFLGKAAAAAKEDRNVLRNPMMISAMAGAMKLLADVHYTGKIIDARIAASNRPPDEVPREIPSGDAEPASPLIQ